MNTGKGLETKAYYTISFMDEVLIPSWTWIARQEVLLKYLDRIAGAPWLALDTEFLRIHTYYPKLCLIQISDGTEHAVIDMQAGLDLSILVERLRRSDRVSVLHACLQDIEIMHHDFDLIPGNAFDTQIAWALLGHGFQISYAAMVEKRLGVALDKSQVRSWWDRRPLKPAQLLYALYDVVYLGPVYQQLLEELEAKGRLSWMQEEMERMLTPSTWIPDPNQVWKRVRIPGSNVPNNRLHVLRGLARWRELLARRENRARARVASDEILVDLACTPLHDQKHFDRVLAGRASWKLRNRLWKALQLAEDTPPLTLKSVSRDERGEQRRKVRILAGVARKVAEEIGVSPELLAPRAMLEELVHQNPDPIVLQGWRGETVGPVLAEALNAL